MKTEGSGQAQGRQSALPPGLLFLHFDVELFLHKSVLVEVEYSERQTQMNRVYSFRRDARGHVEEPPGGLQEVGVGFDSNTLRHIRAGETLPRPYF